MPFINNGTFKQVTVKFGAKGTTTRTQPTAVGNCDSFPNLSCNHTGSHSVSPFRLCGANVGLLGVIALVALAHIVTIPTALAVSEIATNQKVEGGGLYHIISQSFGMNIGAAIGIALFLSQAISTVFYVIAFAEAFTPYFDYWAELTGFMITDKRAITIPTTIISVLMLYKGADIGIKALYAVIGVLFISLAFFFLGSTGHEVNYQAWTDTVEEPDNFFKVFAICFPAFTGIAAGIGLSGDLKDPKVSIPRGRSWLLSLE